MTREEIGRITVGDVYRFAPPGCPEGGTYRVHSFSRYGLTSLDLVVYVGLDGRDEGCYFACSPNDFAVKFRPVEMPAVPAPEPVPDKPAGRISERSGA